MSREVIERRLRCGGALVERIQRLLLSCRDVLGTGLTVSTELLSVGDRLLSSWKRKLLVNTRNHLEPQMKHTLGGDRCLNRGSGSGYVDD